MKYLVAYFLLGLLLGRMSFWAGTLLFIALPFAIILLELAAQQVVRSWRTKKSVLSFLLGELAS